MSGGEKKGGSEKRAQQCCAPTGRAESRRTFLKVAGAGVVLHSTAASYARVLGANDRVRVGVIGFSERFRDALLPAFKQHAAAMNFEFAGLSDIWKLRREEGLTHIKQATVMILPAHAITMNFSDGGISTRRSWQRRIFSTPNTPSRCCARARTCTAKSPWPISCPTRRNCGAR